MKNLAKKLKTPAEKLYKDLTKHIFKEYSHLHLCFKDVAEGEVDLKKIGIPAKLATELVDAIKEKFKPKKITIEGELTLQTYHQDGVEKIKTALTAIEKVSPTINLFYLGAGRFKLIIEDIEYKPAEKNLKKVLAIVDKFQDKQSTATFDRNKND